MNSTLNILFSDDSQFYVVVSAMFSLCSAHELVAVDNLAEGVVTGPVRDVMETIVTRDSCSSDPPATPGLLGNGSSRTGNKLGNGLVLVPDHQSREIVHEEDSSAVGPDRTPESGGVPWFPEYLEAGGPGLALSR